MDSSSNNPLQPQGGVVMAGAPGSPPQKPAETPPPSNAAGTFDVPTPPPPPAPEPTPAASISPPPSAPQETIVVPPSSPTPSSREPGVNPFIPQGVAPEGSAVVTESTVPAAPPPASSRLPRRLLMIIVFLIVLVVLGLAGRYVWSFVAGAKEVTITYWGLWENDTTVRGVLADFETKYPKIKVQYAKQSPRQYRERLQAAITRGEGPDVFRFHNTWISMLRNELNTVPKEIMTAAQFSSTFYPIASRDLVAGQSIYGIPLMIDGLGLYYNEDIFSAAGVTPPTTWEELLNIVPRLTVREEDRIVTSAIALGTTGNVEHFSDIVATMFMQNGATLVEPVGKEAEEALVFYRKFADPSDPVYTWNETLDNSIYAFASGRVAMILAPSWRAFDIKQISPTLRFKILPIPQLPGNTTTWASYWVEGVSTKSKYQKEAWTFVQFLTSREVAVKLYTEAGKSRLFGEPYARVELASSVASDPFVGAYVTQAQDAKSFPLASRTFDNGVNDKLIKYLEDALNGLATGTSPTAVLTTMASGFRQVLGSYGLTSSTAPASR